MRLLLIIAMMVSPYFMMAQVRGGQIKRISSSSKTEVKKTTQIHVNKKKRDDNTREKIKATNPYRYDPDVMEPLPLSSLAAYNVVVCSVQNIDNARRQCRNWRNSGYKSEIYRDPNMGVYQILIGLTNNEQEAINLKNRAGKGAWIFYMVDGIQQIYRK